MPRKRLPRSLKDISSLFLSLNGNSSDRASRRPVEAVVWIAVLGRSINRAHLAIGMGKAFSGIGLSVTLLEVGRGLPNAGYYLALEPCDYLATTLDGPGVVRGEAGPGFEYYCAADPSSIRSGRSVAGEAERPHIVLTAFSIEPDALDEDYISEIARLSGRFCTTGRGEAPPPEAVVTCPGVGRGGPAQSFIEFLRRSYPDSFMVLAEEGDSPGPDSFPLERISLPRGLRRSWARRAAPSEPFFGGLASNLLQVLSLRRRKVSRGAVAR